MTRFAWLQSRTQTLTTAVVLAAIVVAAAVTGIQLSHLYSSLVAHCTSGCDLATGQFLSHQGFMQQALDLLARVTPALIGIFWGAPLLAREFETGTYRLAWTQSVTRSRWVLTRLAVGGLVTLAVAGLLTLTITWWYRALDPLDSTRFALFDRRDIAPISYAVFAFAAGALLGAVIRRSLPAMAATLGVYVFVLVGFAYWVRPHLLTPLHETISLLGAGSGGPPVGFGFRNGGDVMLFVKGSGPPNSWTISSHLLDSSGRQPTSAQVSALVHQYCPNVGIPPVPAEPGKGIARVVGPDAGHVCLDKVAATYHLMVTYQPASRYWTFQWLETGIFFALALAAATGCYWWVTRRSN